MRVLNGFEVRSAALFGLVSGVCGVVFLAVLAASLWGLAGSSGTTDRLSGFLQSAGGGSALGLDGASFVAGIVAVGAVAILASTLVWTLMALLFNAIAVLVGGVRFAVLEEEAIRPTLEAVLPSTGGLAVDDQRRAVRGDVRA